MDDCSVTDNRHSDNPAHAAWIAENVPDYASAYGQCAAVTEAMAIVFPELRRVRGHYYCGIWGERAHWWLETRDDKIVDPTAIQFPSKGRGNYEEYDGRPLPTGPCDNCGEAVYDGGTVCSERCHHEFVASLMSP